MRILTPRADQEKRPYKFQPYPSTRYHADGRRVTVTGLKEDQALGQDWRDTPYPLPPMFASPPPPTNEELKVTIAELELIIDRMKTSALQSEFETGELKKFSEHRVQEVQDLRAALKKFQSQKGTPQKATEATVKPSEAG